jgi:hypothetical protein
MRRQIMTGAAAALCAAGAVAVPAIGQSPAPDTTPPEVSIAFSSTQLESRLLGEGVQFGLAASENVKVNASLSMGGRTFDANNVVARATTDVRGPGKQLVKLALTDRGRELIRQDGTELMVLHVTATDAAGNQAAIGDRLSRTQRLQARRAGGSAAAVTGATVLRPGAEIPIDFPGYREPANDRLPANYRIVRYHVSAVRGDQHTMTLKAPKGFGIVTLGVAEGSQVTPTVRNADYPGHRSVRVELNFNPKIDRGQRATGTWYLLAHRA